MIKITQKQTNPYPFSDTNKRYYTLDYYLRQTYGHKCAKIILDAGFTCPNIDGKCGYGGCIYCSGRGSGDSNAYYKSSLRVQYDKQIELLNNSNKWHGAFPIPYLQAHTNTYAPFSKLKKVYDEILTFPNAVEFRIATRADCLSDDVLLYLEEKSKQIPITLELGLQTSNDKTAMIINRGHNYSDFVFGFNKIKKIAPHVKIGVHIIFGLPGESYDDMISTTKNVSKLHPDFCKIHLLHILKNTLLEKMYHEGQYTPMSRENYIRTVVDAITILPSDIVLERLTGDGLEDDLIAPEWSKRKLTVINDIDKILYSQNLWQGKNMGLE